MILQLSMVKDQSPEEVITELSLKEADQDHLMAEIQ